MSSRALTCCVFIVPVYKNAFQLKLCNRVAMSNKRKRSILDALFSSSSSDEEPPRSRSVAPTLPEVEAMASAGRISPEPSDADANSARGAPTNGDPGSLTTRAASAQTASGSVDSGSSSSSSGCDNSGSIMTGTSTSVGSFEDAVDDDEHNILQNKSIEPPPNDALCVECGHVTMIRCDHCARAVCRDHRVLIANNGPTGIYLCYRCVPRHHVQKHDCETHRTDRNDRSRSRIFSLGEGTSGREASASQLDDWVELLMFDQPPPSPPRVLSPPRKIRGLLSESELREDDAGQFFRSWRDQLSNREASLDPYESNIGSRASASQRLSPVREADEEEVEKPPSADSLDLPLSAECVGELHHAIDRATNRCSDIIFHLAPLGISYDAMLLHGRRLIRDLASGCVHYIGIAQDPLHRFVLADWAHQKKGWAEMHVLVAATPFVCGRLETFFVEDGKRGNGPRALTNKAPGGGHRPHAPHCFLYVCV